MPFYHKFCSSIRNALIELHLLSVQMPVPVIIAFYFAVYIDEILN